MRSDGESVEKDRFPSGIEMGMGISIHVGMSSTRGEAQLLHDWDGGHEEGGR